MKGLLWIGVALLAGSPLAAQDDEEGGVFGGFGPGDEPDLPQLESRGNQRQRQSPNPVDELDAILSKGGQPLNADQKKTIQALLEQQVEEMRQAAEQRRAALQEGASSQGGGPTAGSANGQRASGEQHAPTGSRKEQAGTDPPGAFGGSQGQEPQGGQGARVSQAGPGPGRGGGFRTQDSDAARGEEEKFIANFLPVLTPEQATVWNNFRKDQIRTRGGYPALKLALEEAGTPPTPEQETQLQRIFRTYDEQKRELQRAAGPGGQPDAAKRKQADEQYLASLIKALNVDQRKALLEWRRNSPSPSN